MVRILTIIIFLYSYNLLGQRISKDRQRDHGVSIIFDNDILKFRNQTDQYYSFGQFIEYYQSINQHSKFYNKIFSPFNINGKYIYHSELGLKGYTPLKGNTGIIDRQFAGILTLNNSFTNVTYNQYLKLTIEIGIRGENSGAAKFQNTLHRWLGNEELIGWETQLSQKGLINIYGKWSKSILITHFFDFIPEANLALGNNQTYVSPKLQARLGWFNDLDNTGFYKTNVGDKADAKSEIETYLLFQIYSKLSIVDATLSQNERNVRTEIFEKRNLLAGFSLEVHVNYGNISTFFSYNKTSPVSNIVPRHSYGSIGVAYRW